MAEAKILMPFIKKWEGGFVNDPNDLGGTTNMGITLSTYTEYCRKKGYPKPTVIRLKNISESEWLDIFRIMYWDKWKADKINSQSVANILVDWLWNSGTYGIKIPQALVNVPNDGIVGPKTISAINAQNPRELFDRIKIARFDFIDSICKSRPANERYRRGWMNRINDLKFTL